MVWGTFATFLTVVALVIHAGNSMPTEDGKVDLSQELGDFDGFIAEIMMDEEHIRHDILHHENGRHLESPRPQLALGLAERMEPKELLFLYFQEHDFDKSRSLDGLEIYKAMTHLAEDHAIPVPNLPESAKKLQLRKRVAVIDMALQRHDVNSDGHLTWDELRSAADQMDLIERAIETAPSHGEHL